MLASTLRPCSEHLRNAVKSGKDQKGPPHPRSCVLSSAPACHRRLPPPNSTYRDPACPLRSFPSATSYTESCRGPWGRRTPSLEALPRPTPVRTAAAPPPSRARPAQLLRCPGSVSLQSARGSPTQEIGSECPWNSIISPKWLELTGNTNKRYLADLESALRKLACGTMGAERVLLAWELVTRQHAGGRAVSVALSPGRPNGIMFKNKDRNPRSVSWRNAAWKLSCPGAASRSSHGGPQTPPGDSTLTALSLSPVIKNTNTCASERNLHHQVVAMFLPDYQASA